MLSKSNFSETPEEWIYYPNSKCLSGKYVCKSGYAQNTTGTVFYPTLISEADCHENVL